MIYDINSDAHSGANCLVGSVITGKIVFVGLLNVDQLRIRNADWPRIRNVYADHRTSTAVVLWRNSSRHVRTPQGIVLGPPWSCSNNNIHYGEPVQERGSLTQRVT